MSKNSGKSSSAKGGSSLLTGILIGMIIGVAMAAGMAWYIMKSPSPFAQKEAVVVKPAAPAEKAMAGTAPQPASAPANTGDKPRFEFYKVLTDKQEATVTPGRATPQPAARPPEAKADAKPAEAPGRNAMYLQAGSFSNAADAEKLKAKIAFMGAEASIQTVTIPDKGVWHRVRLGPYKSADDMLRVRDMLKQNGVDATPVHAQ